MANHRLKDLRGPARRNFLRLMGAAGAGFALERSRLLNYLLDQGGSALADEASCAETNRSVHIVCGGGNYAWMQLLWPLVDVANAQNPNFAYHGFQPDPNPSPNNNVGFEVPAMGLNRPFFYGPEAPWADFVNQTVSRPMTAFLGGIPFVHDRIPFRSIMIDGDITSGTSMLGAVSAIQRATVSLLPVIGVAPAQLGSAAGAPSMAAVPSAEGMVELFNSAASKAILAAPEDKALFETYYKAILGLREAAGRPTWARQLDTTKTAANLLGRNLADQLRPQDADLAFYGVPELMQAAVTGGTAGQSRLANLARTLITAKKAMALGLTNSVIIGLPPETGDAGGFTDPHGAFSNMATLRTTVKYIGRFLDRFYADLAMADDPACTSKKLDQTVILTVHGDHPHSPLDRNAWPDATPGNANWIYVLGNGYLKTGWFGHGKTDNTATGVDPTTGQDAPFEQASHMHSACAAVTYAVAKGDMKKVEEFYKGDPIDAFVATPA